MGWKPTTVLFVDKLFMYNLFEYGTYIYVYTNAVANNYSYICDSIFITKFLKSNMNYTASRSAPNLQWKILGMQLVGHRATTDNEKLTLLLNYGQKISKHVQFSNVYNI
jgi:hypothetical protein